MVMVSSVTSIPMIFFKLVKKHKLCYFGHMNPIESLLLEGYDLHKERDTSMQLRRKSTQQCSHKQYAFIALYGIYPNYVIIPVLI